MKANSFFMAIAIALLSLVAVSLSSCSTMDEPNTGIPIRMKVAHESVGLALPDNVLSSENPIRVVGFARDKRCSNYYKVFERDAYVNSNGELAWFGSTEYWPGVYMKFVVYCPADANVSMDSEGGSIEGNYVLLGISAPYCHTSENPSVTLYPFQEKKYY